ncbi:hypothetical protein GW17_00003998 [Ensete ventricosum]|nr:hypothetical protein GW17_00003998 [Ensete ventricosum]
MLILWNVKAGRSHRPLVFEAAVKPRLLAGTRVDQNKTHIVDSRVRTCRLWKTRASRASHGPAWHVRATMNRWQLRDFRQRLRLFLLYLPFYRSPTPANLANCLRIIYRVACIVTLKWSTCHVESSGRHRKPNHLNLRTSLSSASNGSVPRVRSDSRRMGSEGKTAPPKVVCGDAGYVLEDVPHLADYLPDPPVSSLSLCFLRGSV